MPAYRVGGIYSRMPDTVRARAKKRIGSLIRDLAHFVPHSGHTYAVASRTSSKFTAREHAVATDPATVQAAPLGSAHLLSPLSFSLSLYACATFLAREEGEREREAAPRCSIPFAGTIRVSSSRTKKPFRSISLFVFVSSSSRAFSRSNEAIFRRGGMESCQKKNEWEIFEHWLFQKRYVLFLTRSIVREKRTV